MYVHVHLYVVHASTCTRAQEAIGRTTGSRDLPPGRRQKFPRYAGVTRVVMSACSHPLKFPENRVRTIGKAINFAIPVKKKSVF